MGSLWLAFRVNINFHSVEKKSSDQTIVFLRVKNPDFDIEKEVNKSEKNNDLYMK